MSSTCHYCGAPLLPADHFCSACGQPIDAALAGAAGSSPGPLTSFLEAPTIQSAVSPTSDAPIPPPPPDSYIMYAPLASSPPTFPVMVLVPVRKKHRRLWWLLLILPALCCIGAAVAIVIYSFTPTSALENYCSDLTAGNYQGIYALYTMSYQSQVGSEQSFALAAELANSSKGGVKSCAVGTVSSANQEANGVVTVTYGNGSTTSLHIQLDHTTGSWKISGIT